MSRKKKADAAVSLSDAAAVVLGRPRAKREELAGRLRERASRRARMIPIHDAMGGAKEATEAAEAALAFWLAADALEREP